MAEAGYADGFEVPLSIDLSFAEWTEPTAILMQESLGKIGIKTTINKIPGASWRTKALVEKGLELHLKNFGGWLNYVDYDTCVVTVVQNEYLGWLRAAPVT